jgi:glc operon protein GlcG
MTKLGISVGILATVFCLSARAQTINVMALDQDGAQTVLQAAKERAQQRNAPSAIAVVDPAGDLLAFQRMDGVRPASADLAIEKHERPRGCNGRGRRSRRTLIGAERHSSPPASRHCAAVCRYA